MENEDGSLRLDMVIGLEGDEFTMDGAFNFINYLGPKTDSYMNGKVKYSMAINMQSENDIIGSVFFDINLDTEKVEKFNLLLDSEAMENGKAPTLFINDKEFVFTDYARIAKMFEDTRKLLIQ